jgi:hypothetical protein
MHLLPFGKSKISSENELFERYREAGSVRGTRLHAVAPGFFGGFGRTGYRLAKRTLRSASDRDGAAGSLTSYQNRESVADCILSQR